MLKGWNEWAGDPQVIQKAGEKIMQTSAQAVALKEVHSYLREALLGMKLPEKPKDKAGIQLFSMLDIAAFRHNLQKRAADLVKTVDAATQEIEILAHMQRNLSSDRTVDGLDDLNDYTNNIQEVLAETESSIHVRYIIQLVLGGSNPNR